jgi:hypothetical protein
MHQDLVSPAQTPAASVQTPASFVTTWHAQSQGSRHPMAVGYARYKTLFKTAIRSLMTQAVGSLYRVDFLWVRSINKLHYINIVNY